MAHITIETTFEIMITCDDAVSSGSPEAHNAAMKNTSPKTIVRIFLVFMV